jgi:transposase
VSAVKKVRESEIDFLSLSKKEKHSRVRIRLLGLSHVKDRVPYRKVAEMLKVDHISIQNWVNAFAESGLEGLKEHGGRGKKPLFSKEKEDELKKIVLKKQKTRNGGRLVGNDIKKIINERLGIEYSLRSTYDLLHKIGLVCISSRSKHPKSNEKMQEEFKKNFKKKIRRDFA